MDLDALSVITIMWLRVGMADELYALVVTIPGELSQMENH